MMPTSPAVDFRLLGELDVRVGGVRWKAPSRKPRTLLAALLLQAGRLVTRDRLVDAVWDGDPPRSAVRAIQVYASQLRRAVPRVDLVCRGDGYLLDIDPLTVDLHRFRALAADAAHLPPEAAAARLRRAVALFRGTALAGIDSDALRREIEPVLVEEQLAVWERLVDLELALGRDAHLVPDLVRLTREHPLRERFWEQLVLAQGREGRAADASHTFRAARRLLRDELGVEPGPGLREALRSVVEGRAETPPGAAESGRVEVVAAVPGGPNMLPRDLTDFTGRDAELARAVEIVRADRIRPTILLLTGMAGVGKTALAMRLAHTLRGDYPDGQLFVDLHGYTLDRKPLRPSEALSLLLRMADGPTDEATADATLAAARWRATVAGRRMVVVLDDVADVAQVMPLLPGDSPSLVLVTGRSSLAGIDGAHSLPLDVLSTTDGATLFCRIVGAGLADPTDEAVTQAVRLCGNLPLAIRLAAARLRQRPTWPVQELVQRLRDNPRLDELSVGDRSLDNAFAASYHPLPAEEQRMFRLLSLAPGPDIGVDAAAALAAVALPVARRTLEGLLDRNLVEQRRRNRFQLHHLVRRYADRISRLVDTERDRRDAVVALVDHQLGRADDALRLLVPRPVLVSRGTRLPAPCFSDAAAAATWLATERPNLTAAAHPAAYGVPTDRARALVTVLSEWRDVATGTSHHPAVRARIG